MAKNQKIKNLVHANVEGHETKICGIVILQKPLSPADFHEALSKINEDNLMRYLCFPLSTEKVTIFSLETKKKGCKKKQASYKWTCLGNMKQARMSISFLP